MDERQRQLVEAVERAASARRGASGCREAVLAALEGGVDPGDLVGKPYSAAHVRRLARSLGLPPRQSGRKRATDHAQ